MASTVRRMRSSVGRQEAHERHEQERRVERIGLVVLGEDAALVEAVGADVGVDLVGGRLPRARRARSSSRRRARRAPRSAATQHMTFEEVKCFGSPRTSQMPRSGSRQLRERGLDLADQDRPDPLVEVVARLRVEVDRVEHARPTCRAGAGRRRRCRCGPAARPRTRSGGRGSAPAARARRRRRT